MPLPARRGTVSSKKSNHLKIRWLLFLMSGYCDSNTGPSGPKPDALANCATPRIPFLSNWTANIHFNFETTKYFQYFYSNVSPMKRTKWMSEDYLCRRFVKRIRQDKKRCRRRSSPASSYHVFRIELFVFLTVSATVASATTTFSTASLTG